MTDVRERRHQAAAPLRRCEVEQEVGEREAGEGAAVVEVAQHSFVAGIRESLVLVEPAAAELHRVPALEPRELLVELVGLDVVELRVGGVAEPEVA